MGFLPVTKEALLAQGVSQPDFVFVSGDAYIDHPSFAAAIITRVLEAEGFSVGVIAQPDWRTNKDITRFGRPKYGFLVCSGNVDSMVAHYTVAKRRRSEDWYSPGRQMGLRPDRAVDVYCRLIRQNFGDVPLIIGGLEASLRRFAHYDYWADTVLPGILVTSGADLLIYGMGERQIAAIAKGLRDGASWQTLHQIDGCCYLEPNGHALPNGMRTCPSFGAVCADKKAYAKACRMQYDEADFAVGKGIIQAHEPALLQEKQFPGQQWPLAAPNVCGGFVVQNKPAAPLEQEELDRVFALPFMRSPHPMYDKEGGVPAILEVQHSVMHNRGCFGACNFCAIAFHQGRYVTARSKESVLEEVQKIIAHPQFKGYIHDVGGPSANFRMPACAKQKTRGACKGGKKCLAPGPCPNLKVDHTEYLDLLREIRRQKGVKKVFVRSGIRYDYLLEDKDQSFFKELVEHHVSGQLKVAPEHCSAAVLDAMGKPHFDRYIAFAKQFARLTKQVGKEQYLVPYLMSSHPGSTPEDAIALARYLKENHLRPEQVQDFYPTPGTVSTCMFYTGLDPYTMQEIYVPRTPAQKAEQRLLLQYFKPENHKKVVALLRRLGHLELIGHGPNCLVPPPAGEKIAQKAMRPVNQKGQKAAGGSQKTRGGQRAKGQGGKKGERQKPQTNEYIPKKRGF